MTTYAIQCGRLPQLSVLELEAVLPRFGVRPESTRMQREIYSFTSVKPLLDEQVQSLQASLGGTIRIIELCRTTSDTSQVAEICTKLATELFDGAVGKLTVGVSVWNDADTHLRPFDVARTLKRGMVSAGASLRFVTAAQNGMHLSTAQLIHNKLAWLAGDRTDTSRALELCAIHVDGAWQIGHTLTGQNINSYTKRDFGIPVPDAESGMLPPKLAQIMLNIALHDLKLDDVLVYDPFCGNGRVVLEARLLGLPSVGSDIVERKTNATQENLKWLQREYPQASTEPATSATSWVGDATDAKSFAPAVALAGKLKRTVVIVAEPFLGKPLRTELPESGRESWLAELATLYTSFFEAVLQEKQVVTRLLVVFPRAKVAASENNEAGLYEHMIDTLDRFGYSHQRLFCYDRPDSFVRRDLVELSPTT